MLQQPKTFQMVVVGVFVVLIILGFLGFSGKLDGILPSSGKDVNYGEVTLWGTVPTMTMQSLISNYLSNNKSITINYVQKNPETLNSDFVEALARGKGPDMIMLSQDEILKNGDKLGTLPYQTFPERDFKNTFLQEGELFLRPNGIIAMPFTIDPIVMYWNRDIFTNALIPTPPTLWTDFYSLVPKITIRDNQGGISKSLVAFGGYRNVSNAKEVVSLLAMQAGSPVVTEQNGVFSPGLVTQDNLATENPVISALRFFTEFSKSGKDSYSWNSSLPQSRSMFESGDLAIYLGYASEYKSIQQRNPHLNFDVAMVPQAGNSPVKLTFGKMYGIATSMASKNPQGSIYAMLLLSSKDLVSGVSALSGLPPVRRDLIGLRPTDAALSVFYDSALISRAWHDPAPSATNLLFMSMIESVTSGRSSMSQALVVAQGGLGALLAPYR